MICSRIYFVICLFPWTSHAFELFHLIWLCIWTIKVPQFCCCWRGEGTLGKAATRWGPANGRGLHWQPGNKSWIFQLSWSSCDLWDAFGIFSWDPQFLMEWLFVLRSFRNKGTPCRYSKTSRRTIKETKMAHGWLDVFFVKQTCAKKRVFFPSSLKELRKEAKRSQQQQEDPK